MTGLDRVPICEMTTSKVSPGLRKIGGLRLKPMPLGVPVARMSPGFQVRALET
ncbi:hypothetical protein D3C71_1979990 [compost metagenome]